MAALHDRRARLLASLYSTYGEPATWTPAGGGAAIPVTIRRHGEDIEVGFGGSAGLATKDFLRVRPSEVAAPARNDVVEVLDAPGGNVVATFRIIADPRLVKAGGEWVCEPGPVRT